MKTERQLDSEFRKWLEGVGEYTIRIPDPQRGVFSLKRPFDGFLTLGERALFCPYEAKRVTGMSFNLKKMEEHQVEELDSLMTVSGIMPVVILYCLHTYSDKRKLDTSYPEYKHRDNWYMVAVMRWDVIINQEVWQLEEIMDKSIRLYKRVKVGEFKQM